MDHQYLCIDMHCHSHHSTDGVSRVASILRKAKKHGIGVAITDHNTIEGSQQALELSAGEVVVIPGIEVTTIERKDYIIYFYSPDDMAAFYKAFVHRKRTERVVNRTDLSSEDLIKAARQYRVFLGAPHPFGYAYKGLYRYLKRKDKESILDKLDGLEGINGNLGKAGNMKAVELASRCGLPIFGGSDAHSLTGVGNTLTCSRASDYREFLDNMAAGDGFILTRRNKVYPCLSPRP